MKQFTELRYWEHDEVYLLDKEDKSYVIKEVTEFEKEFFKQFPIKDMRVDVTLEWEDIVKENSSYIVGLLNHFFEMNEDKW